MKRTLLATVAAAGMLVGGAAYADCNTSMAGVGADYDKISMANRHATADNRAVMRNLRDAAHTLKANGNEDGCEAVVSAMKDVVEDMREQAAEKMEEKTGMTAAERHEKARERAMTLVTAKMTLNTTDLKGTDVYNWNDEFLGEIDGVILGDGGKASHMIVGHGGFLSIGDDEAAVPLSKLRWDPEREVLYLNMTEEQLENAPDYDKVDGKWMIDANDDYYKDIES